jgi:aldehyde dehydrogenase (NAD+)
MPHSTPLKAFTATDHKSIHSMLEIQRAFFESGKTLPYKFRDEQLKRLKAGVKKFEVEFISALKSDLGKSSFETYIGEIGFLYGEIDHTRKHLKSWMRNRNIGSSILLFPSFGSVSSDPKGCVLIMSPWNYPVQLALAPLIGALAAGNCAMIKPSEVAPATAKVVGDMIADTFPKELVSVVQGDASLAKALLQEQFDHIFFTGSTEVGRQVAMEAAKQLIPVTLELGGKSPCIVEPDANLPVAARRIVWGKFFNAGQTCVAPDYILVHNSIKTQFIKEISQAITKAFGENPEESPDLDRLVGLMGQGRVVFGGKANRETSYIEPTIIDDVRMDHKIMSEEIFGPLLPILGYNDLNEAKMIIKQRPKPLALYLFSENAKTQDDVIRSIPFGGGCINDLLLHLCHPDLPFGGVGPSGLGAYHGQDSFRVFSNQKSVLKTPTAIDVPVRYAPYGKKESIIRMLLN